MSNVVGTASIVFDADASNVKMSAKEMASAIASLKQSVSQTDKGLRSSFSGYSAAISKNVKTTRDFNRELRSLEAQASKLRAAIASGNREESSAFGLNKKSIEKAEKNVDKLSDKLNDLRNTRRATDDPQFEIMEKQVDKLDKQIGTLNKKRDHIKELISASGDTNGVLGQDLKSVNAELESVANERAKILKKMNPSIDKDVKLDNNINNTTKTLEAQQKKLKSLYEQRDKMLSDGTAYDDSGLIKNQKNLKDIEARIRQMKAAIAETPSARQGLAASIGEDVKKAEAYLVELQKKRDEFSNKQNDIGVRAMGSQEAYDRVWQAIENGSEGARKQLIEGISSIGATDEYKETSAAIREYDAEIDRTTASIARMRGEMAGMSNAPIDSIDMSNVEEIDAAIKQSEENLNNLYDVREKLQGADADVKSASIQELTAQIAATKQEAQELRAEEQRLKDAGDNFGTDALEDTQDAIRETEADLQEYEAELESVKSNGGDELAAAWDSNDAAINREIERLGELKEAKQELQTSGAEAGLSRMSMYMDAYMRKWQQMATLSGMVGNSVAAALTPIVHPIQAVDRALGTIISRIGQAISSFARMAGNGAISFLKRLASEARNAAVQLAKLATNAVSGGFKKIASGAASAAKGLLNFTRSHNNTNNGLKMGLKTILKYAFGVRSMFFLFRRLRSAVIEGLGEIGKQNPAVKAAMDGLSGSLNGLKASLATAFAPIITAIAPILITLISLLTAAANAVGAFFAALSGGSTFSKAITGLTGVGKAAGGAGGAVDKLKRKLAGFDELNIVKSENKGGGGGGGGKGSAYKYEKSPIPEDILDFANKIREYWINGEYEKIGELVGQKINAALEAIYKAVKWKKVFKKWKTALDAFAGIFNGLIKGINWPLIVRTVREGIKSLLKAAEYLLSNISFKDAGAALASALNELFNDTEMWATIQGVIKTAIGGAIDFVQAFLDNLHEGEIATKIREALENGVDWEGVAEGAWTAIKTAFNKAGNFINVLLGGEDHGGRGKQPKKPIAKGKHAGEITETYEDKLAGSKPTSYDKVWDELAENFAQGANRFIAKATEVVEGLNPAGVLNGFLQWTAKIRSGISFKGLGAFIGASFKLALDTIETIIYNFRVNAPQMGTDLAAAINAIIKAAFSGTTISDAFTNAVIGVFKLGEAFVAALDAEGAADTIRKAVKAVPWGEIADAAWGFFTTALSKAGDFLTVLLGGQVSMPDDVVEAHPMLEANQDTRSFGALLGNAVSTAFKTGLDIITKGISEIDWEDVGAGLHDFITNLDWEGFGQKLASALSALFDGLDDFIWSAIFGKDFKENDIWRSLHPDKAAEYDTEKMLGGSETAAKALTEMGVTAEEYSKALAAATIPDNQVFLDESGVLGQLRDEARAKLSEYDHAINLAEAKDTAQQMLASGEPTAIAKVVEHFSEIGLTIDEGKAILQELGVKMDENTEAAESQTEASQDVTDALERSDTTQPEGTPKPETKSEGISGAEALDKTLFGGNNVLRAYEEKVNGLLYGSAEGTKGQTQETTTLEAEFAAGVADMIAQSDAQGSEIVDAVNETTAAVKENGPESGSAQPDYSTQSGAELAQRAVELIGSGLAKSDVLKQFAEGGLPQEKVDALSTALDHVKDTIFGPIEDADFASFVEAIDALSMTKEQQDAWDRFDKSGQGASEIYDKNGELYNAGTGQSVAEMFDDAAAGIAESAAALDGAIEVFTKPADKQEPEDIITDEQRTTLGEAIQSAFTGAMDVILGGGGPANAEEEPRSLDALISEAQGLVDIGFTVNDVIPELAKTEAEAEALRNALADNVSATDDNTTAIETNQPQGPDDGQPIFPSADEVRAWYAENGSTAKQKNAQATFPSVEEVQEWYAENGSTSKQKKATEDFASAAKRETKEVKKNTKEIKRNTKKRAEVDVNYEGAGFDTSGGKPKLNVELTFAPAGEEPDDSEDGSGILGWLQKILDPGVSVETKVNLIKQGWQNFKEWLGIGSGSTIDVLIKLAGLVGKALLSLLGLNGDASLDTFINLAGTIGKSLLGLLGLGGSEGKPSLKTWIELALNAFKSLAEFLGIDDNNPLVALIKAALSKDSDDNVWKLIGADGKSISIGAAITAALKGAEWLEKMLGLKPGTLTGIIDVLANLLTNNLPEPLKKLLGIDTNPTGVKVDGKKGDVESGAQNLIDLIGKVLTGKIQVSGILGSIADGAAGLISLIGKTVSGIVKILGEDGTVDEKAKKIIGLIGGTFAAILKINAKEGETDDKARGLLALVGQSLIAWVTANVKGGEIDSSGRSILALAAQTLIAWVTANVKGGSVDDSGKSILALAGEKLVAWITANVKGGDTDDDAKNILALAGQKLSAWVTAHVKGGEADEEGNKILALIGKKVSAWVTANLKGGETDDEAKNILAVAGQKLSALVKASLGKGEIDNAAQTVLDKAGQSYTTTLKSDVKRGSTWIPEAFTAANMDGKTVDRTLKQSVKMSVWDALAALIAQLGGATINRTINQSVKQGAWSAMAFTAATLTTDNGIQRTLTAIARTGAWSALAWSAAQMKTDNGIQRTITAIATTGAWSALAWSAAQMKTGDIKRTITVFTKQGSAWNASAYKALSATSKTVTMTVQMVVKKNKADFTVTRRGSNTHFELKEMGGIITRYGRSINFANGGQIMRNGRASWYDAVNKYAEGTSRAHGTVFVAGEAGPEIMGHINGRTEILNKSQLADAIYAAVVSGMGQAVNALGLYLANHMTNCTNSIVRTIAANTGWVDVGNIEYHEPVMASGGIMPYDVTMQIARSAQEIQSTLDANNEDLIQAMVSAIGNAASSIVQAMMTQQARNVSSGNGMTARQTIDAINRSTLMFGQSPLKGV